MTVTKVVVIVLIVTYLEWLYIQANASTLLTNAITTSAQNALGTVAGSTVVDIGSSLANSLGVSL